MFCAEHRLPENHACPHIEKVKAPKVEASPFEYKVTYTAPRLLSRFRFSSTELRHLAISALLVSGVGLSMLGSSLMFAGYGIVIVLVVLFTLAFLLHEIAHKITAQRFGLWAEFRLTLFGSLITLLSVVSPFFKIIAPGAVMIAGAASKDIVGKTSLAGPLTNIAFGTASLALTFLVPSPFLEVAVFTAAFNAFIAVLNLIPVGILDGWKVFSWSKVVWVFAFIPSLILLIAVFAVYAPYFELL